MSSDTVTSSQVTVFLDWRRLESGPREAVMLRLRERADALQLMVFDNQSGERVDIDLRPLTPPGDAASPPPAAADAPPTRGVGRPKLGVVAREVTLLPRHWDWLSRQPGGASVALRRLIDEARDHAGERDIMRASREAAYRVMCVLACDLPGFEEASRSLFACERARFFSHVSDWPSDVADYVCQLAESSWEVHNPHQPPL